MLNKNSTIFKTWLNDLSIVTKATEGINMSIMAVGAADYSKAIDGLSLSQAKLLLNMQGVDAEQQKSLLLQAGLISSSEKMTASHVAQALSNTTLKNTEQERVLVKAGLMNAQSKELLLGNSCTEAKLREVLATTTLSSTEKDAVVSRILGTTANGGYAISFDVLTASIWANIKAMAKWLITNPVGWCVLAVGAIAGLSKIIDELVVTEEELNEQLDELSSKWDELSSTIQNSSKSFQSLKSQADELIPRYAELAQGVDKYGKTVSLTDEEFSEFVSLNNQLGQMFPELVMGYDSNGNAILALSGNVDTLTESLYAFVEAQRIASAQTIADTMPEVMSNIDSTVEAYKSQIKIAEDSMEDLKELYDTFKNDGFVEEWSSTGESMVSAAKILNKYGIDYSSEITGERNGVVGSTRYKITVDWDDFETSYDGVIAGYEKKIDDLGNRIESKWKQLNPVVSAWLSTDFLYHDMDVSGQSLVTAMVGEIDFKSLGLKTEKEIQNYITNSIISPIYDMDTATQQAFFDVFDLHEALNNGELSAKEYQDKINAILENGDYSQEFTTIFKLAFAESNLQDEYNKAITKFGEDNKDTLEKFFTDNSINTIDEIHYWNKVTEGAKTASEAVKMYNNVKGDTFNDENPISTITSSIEQIATQLEPQFKKLGDAYQNIFTADGFTLDAVDNSMLEDLRKTFTEIEEEIGVTFDTTQLENFFAVLSNSNSTAEQTQEAFNNIATSYLYSTDVLESLNSTTVDSIAKQLESLGIINASQLATEALAAKEEYLAFARREHTDEAGNLVSVTQDLANATADDINVLIAEQGALEGEGIALDETTQKMIAYWMQKQAANGQLSTVGDIQQLSALCEGLGVSSKALRNYIYFKKLASMTDVYDAASIERFSANAEKNMEQAQADIQSIYDKLGGAEINFAVPDTSKKSKSEKDTTKEFDWIEQAIKNVEKEVTKLDNIVNSAYSTFSQKNEALAKEIGKVNEEIQLQQQAYDEYMRKADSIGLSDDYKTLIQNGEINIENISDKNLQERISEYQQWYEKAVDASDAISELSTKVKDLHVAGYELQADRLEELLDNEAITEKRYLSEMDKLYKQYYENQTDYAVQAHEAKLALLNREKEYLNSVANAATSLLDKEIDKVQDNAKEQQEPYEDQIKAAEKQIDAYEDQIKLFEKQIDAHNKQIDAYNKEIDLINDRKKPLQDELDALEDKAREENLILSLQEKQYNLKKAENQKDKLVNYMPDTIVI